MRDWLNSPSGIPHAINTPRYRNERELRQHVSRSDLLDLCRQLGVEYRTYEQTINGILLTNVKKKFTTINKTKTKDEHNSMNDYNRGALEYTLPWSIIQRILTYASQYNSRCTCVMVDRDTLKRNDSQTRQKLILDRLVQDKCDPQFQTILHTSMMLQNEMKKRSLTRDQLCPLHQFDHDQGFKPNIELEGISCQVSREDCRWMRSMALLSKRVFAFISTTLFTNIVMDPTADTWSHITNNYCIIKQPKILTYVSPSSDTQLFLQTNHSPLHPSNF
ncbi:hypothetical protein DFA_11343 [Cavenderia fasciculata]|uniref:Uncharacterized protein n=1 Tax=Cavenderia fasciculata TaxID=261658 RepID=F4QCE7_CACFS|nr:uncharacterized protein DFA_11343 [Cavenderia fasciculata]EGG13582.1 hypothetical protein DFA_11343 [Cavenderia fasciculata]|eukprot:XP_004350286.1 hypothetical protein DFA_11343 [Cavenderia fasciculata]